MVNHLRRIFISVTGHVETESKDRKNRAFKWFTRRSLEAREKRNGRDGEIRTLDLQTPSLTR